MSLFVICEILGLFVNTFTTNDKYCLRNSDNLLQPIQMHLSKEQNTFSGIFLLFLKFTLYFEHIEAKDDPQSLFISEISNCEIRGQLNV